MMLENMLLPELMAIRKFKKDGTPLLEKQIAKKFYQFYLVSMHLMLIRNMYFGKSC
jgi:hypothetical protein